MKIYGISDIGSRKYQEDRYNVDYNIFDMYDYLAIFDGHAGDDVAIWMQNNHKDIVRKLLIDKEKPENALIESIKIVKKIMPNNISKNIGCTAIIILKRYNSLWCCNIGDCRSIISYDDKVESLSTDHKPNRPDELLRIQNLGGIVTKDIYGIWRVNGNLAISRAIGDLRHFPYVISDPEIITYNINSHNKYILMASDGLWDVLNNSETMNIIKNVVKLNKFEGSNLLMKVICHKLLKVARSNSSNDNITILLIFL